VTAVFITVAGLDKMLEGFEGLILPPDYQTIGKFEATLAETFVAVDAKVHVLTGALKASGTTHTDYDGSTWSGSIEFAEHPGIFELARGDEPSLNHPEGGHAFFDATKLFHQQFEDDLKLWVESHLGKAGA
jgi:hypothetical protein